VKYEEIKDLADWAETMYLRHLTSEDAK
jgi:hypothetical protein